MKRTASIKINSPSAGLTILDFLSRRFTYHTRHEWREEIQEGNVLLNQYTASPGTILASGDRLEYLRIIVEPPVQTDFSILYEDSFLLAVDKPPNLPCHPAGRYFHHTLWALLKTEMNISHLSFVNRIDRETSGVVLLAKDPRIASLCREQFQRNQVYKRYVGIVEGIFPPMEIRARGYLNRDPNSAVRKKLRFYSAGSVGRISNKEKMCYTIFRRLEIGKEISLVEAIPETGRSQQIRATLCSLGFPLVGDKLYGVDERFFLRFINEGLSDPDWKRLRIGRQALHAAELRMQHPRTQEPLLFTAPVPLDMQKLVTDSEI